MVQRARGLPLGRGPEGQSLEQGVHRRGDAVEAAQQRDLPVEELGLDGAGAAGQALPARPALPLARGGGSHLQVVGPPFPVLLGAGHVDAGGGQRGRPLLLGLLGQRAETAGRTAQRLDRVGQVHQQLAVLPAHDVGPGDRLEGRAVDGVGNGLSTVVEARGEAAEIEHARHGCGVHLDHSRMELGGRAHDAHAVGVGEVAQDPAFVLHAVLHADDGDGRRRGGQLGQRVIGVLPLDTQEDDGVLGPGHLGGLGHDGDGQGDGLVRRLEAKSRRGQGRDRAHRGQPG